MDELVLNQSCQAAWRGHTLKKDISQIKLYRQTRLRLLSLSSVLSYTHSHSTRAHMICKLLKFRCIQPQDKSEYAEAN